MRILSTCNRLVALTALVAPLLLSGCFHAYLSNQTGDDLQHYDVVDLKRQLVGLTLPNNATIEIDHEGFNPLYYSPTAQNDTGANAVLVQFDLQSEPQLILTRILAYPVAPDQIVTSPTLQPTMLDEYLLEIDPSTENVKILVDDQFKVTYAES